jgi:hypothetical protein
MSKWGCADGKVGDGRARSEGGYVQPPSHCPTNTDPPRYAINGRG